MSRPILDDVKRGQICAMLAVGCTRQTAAAFVGCDVSTIRRTALRDEKFAADLRHAEHGLEFLQLKNIQKASERSWQASAWMLERRFPDTYAKRDPRLVTPQQVARLVAGFAETIATEITSPDDRLRVLARLQDLAAALESAAAEPKRPKRTTRT